MRTTLDIDDDILKAARSLAAGQGISLGKAISELARRGLRPGPVDTVGFPTFSVNPEDPPITPEHVKSLLDEW